MKRIALKDITDIRVGINATQILKRHDLLIELDNLYLSVITKSRSLDLKANDPATRNRWVQACHRKLLFQMDAASGQKKKKPFKDMRRMLSGDNHEYLQVENEIADRSVESLFSE